MVGYRRVWFGKKGMAWCRKVFLDIGGYGLVKKGTVEYRRVWLGIGGCGWVYTRVYMRIWLSKGGHGRVYDISHKPSKYTDKDQPSKITQYSIPIPTIKMKFLYMICKQKYNRLDFRTQ